MQVVGIICEYNPFHKGHFYHISESVNILGQDTAVVCAMSGDFVQRGEPAVFSKFARAEAAVKCGADLVVELPVTTALSSAEGFAMGAVKLLDSLGVCTHLSFGSEAGELAHLESLAEAMLVPEMDMFIKEELERGISYASARHNALKRIAHEKAEIIVSPNNILAVEYLKALKTIKSEMIPITVSRTGGDHDGSFGYSASAVRAALKEGNGAYDAVPEAAKLVFEREMACGRGPVFTEAIESAVMYRLRTMTQEEFDMLPFASEGLGQRLYKNVKSSTCLTEILEKTKTKRYAMSRLRRMIMCAYLGLTAEDMKCEPEYIRVLGASARGRNLLKKMRDTAKLPVITKAASAKSLLKNSEVTDLYTLGYKETSQRMCGTDITTSPYIEK